MQFQVPPQLGEITVQEFRRQEFEQELTRSNWRHFCAMQSEKPSPESPLPGTGRRDEDLLGQQGSDQQAHDPRDYSSRILQAIATLRQAITKRGGQPR